MNNKYKNKDYLQSRGALEEMLTELVHALQWIPWRPLKGQFHEDFETFYQKTPPGTHINMQNGFATFFIFAKKFDCKIRKSKSVNYFTLEKEKTNDKSNKMCNFILSKIVCPRSQTHAEIVVDYADTVSL